MNKVFLCGRLTTEPEPQQIPSGVSCVKFRLAVNRARKNKEGVREADFFNITAWRASADFVSRYIHKGDAVIVVGTIQTRSYDAQDGTKRYVTEIIADEVESVGGRREDAQEPTQKGTDTGSGFAEVEDDRLPF